MFAFFIASLVAAQSTYKIEFKNMHPGKLGVYWDDPIKVSKETIAILGPDESYFGGTDDFHTFTLWSDDMLFKASVAVHEAPRDLPSDWAKLRIAPLEASGNYEMKPDLNQVGPKALVNGEYHDEATHSGVPIVIGRNSLPYVSVRVWSPTVDYKEL